MGKLHKRFEKAATWENLVTPTIKKKLDEVVFKSRMCKITFAGGDEYQVMEGVTVHIDITGVSCKHVAACISHRRMNIETFFPQEALKPPILKRLPGRPPNSRRREAGEAAPGASDSRRPCTLNVPYAKKLGTTKGLVKGLLVFITGQTSGVAISQESGKGSSQERWQLHR
ncbi:hypothetical protein CsSME_00029575 [Camellia sinensis var. sinensis]